MSTVQLAHNSTIAKLINPTREMTNEVSELLSYQVAGADHMYAFNAGTWDGRSSFYEFKNNTFPAGFAYLVHAELSKKHTVHLVRAPAVLPLGPENPIVDAFGNDSERYDFQMLALARIEKHQRGIIQVATGGGKSKIAKLIMSRYRRMTLFLTTRGILLYQMDKQLVDMGLNTGIVGDGEFRVVRGINMGMVQTLVAALEEPSIDVERRAITKTAHGTKKGNPEIAPAEVTRLAQIKVDEKIRKRAKIIKFLELIEVVIGEEAHEAGGDSYFKILQHCKNATIRVALTATPFMRSNAEDNMRLMAAFGPVLLKVSEETLINRGILAKPYFKYTDSLPHPKLRRTSPFDRAYTLGYVENDHMHADIVADAQKAKAHGLPVLALISRTKHGDALLAAYRAAGMAVRFIKGETDMAGRMAALKQLAAGEIDVLIGSTILDVGVDVPAIGLLQLCGGMKAEVALRQRIGRSLREKKRGPNIAFVIDYSTNTNSYLSDHTRQRRGIVENTPGFAENIVTALPWHLFEKVAT